MDFLITTLNAKFIHSSLALRSLKKYCTVQDANIIIKEYTINNTVDSIVLDIYKTNAYIIGFSVYIWNIEMTLEIISILKKANPEIIIFVGGPESYGLIENKNIDIAVIGEGEVSFNNLMEYFTYKNKKLSDIKGIVYKKNNTVYENEPEQLISLDSIPFVYDDLSEFENKIIYYESSRGCPFKCQYCMSSLIKGVRYLSMDRTFKDLQFFLDNNIKQVKFVDRTFNCSKERTYKIWEYLIKNDNGITNFHFEIAADLLDESQFDILKNARTGLIQFEIGVQSTNQKTLEAIERKTNIEKLFYNVKKIKGFNNIHQHLDLIAGLPFEDYNSFKNSFNDVFSVFPEQLQLGFLKVLKETGMDRNSEKFGIVYREKAPYEVIKTNWISFGELLKLKCIEEVTELYYNSGRFKKSIKYILNFFISPFDFFEKFGEFWNNNNFNEIKHNKISLYLILLDFCNDCNISEIAIIKDLLKYDILLNENIRSLPEIFRNELNIDEKNSIKELFRNNDLECFNNLENYSVKQKYRLCNIEKFNYNIITFVKNCGKIEKETVFILFNYSKDNSTVKSGLAKSETYDITNFIS